MSNIRIVHGQVDPIPPGTTSGTAQAVPSRKYLLNYVPDFYFRNTPGFKLLSVEDYACTVCVDMKGNSGGAVIDDFHWSAYKIGIDIDGSLDTVNITRPHWFPYFMNADQQTLFLSEGAVVTGLKPNTNTGNGTFVDSPVSNSLNFATLNSDGSNYHHLLGTYHFIATSSTAFKLVDPNGTTLATNIPINAYQSSYFNYTITSGSTAFAAGDEFDSVVTDIPSIGVNMARMDDFKIANGLFLGGVGVNMYQTPASTTNNQNGGTPGGTMANVDFDTTTGIIMSHGMLFGSGVEFATLQHAQGIDVTGGTLSLGNGFVIEASHDGKPINHFGGNVASGNYELSNYAFATTADIFNVYQDGGILTLMGDRFSRSPGATYVNPAIYIPGGSYTIAMGNSMSPFGNGKGTFIYAPIDSLWNKFIGNMGVGWQSTYPTGTTQGYYAGNN